MMTLCLRPQSVAQALDVGLDTLDHWIQEGWLSAGTDPRQVHHDTAHEALDLAQVLRFIRRHHLTIHRPDALGLQSGPWGSRRRADEVQHLLAALASPEAEDLSHLLLGRFATVTDLPAYFDGPLTEALTPCRQALTGTGPAQQAAQTLEQAAGVMRKTAMLISSRADHVPVDMAVALEDDRDPTPAALAAMVAVELGHRLVDPGPTASAPAIVRAGDEQRPGTVILTVSAPSRPDEVTAEQLSDLAHRLTAQGARIFVVGPRADLAPAHLPRTGRMRDLARHLAS